MRKKRRGELKKFMSKVIGLSARESSLIKPLLSPISHFINDVGAKDVILLVVNMSPFDNADFPSVLILWTEVARELPELQIFQRMQGLRLSRLAVELEHFIRTVIEKSTNTAPAQLPREAAARDCAAAVCALGDRGRLRDHPRRPRARDGDCGDPRWAHERRGQAVESAVHAGEGRAARGDFFRVGALFEATVRVVV
jgi:hypothetical protein